MNNLIYISDSFLEEATQINPLSEIRVRYKKYSDSHGYWIVENLFSNISSFVKLMELFPISSPVFGYNINPFFVQKVPTYFFDKIKHFIGLFCFDVLQTDVIFTDSFDRGNIYQHGKVKCTMSSILPHVDYSQSSKNFLVSNIWLSEGYNGGTSFWKYKDQYVYFDQYSQIYENLPLDKVEYYNFETNDVFTEVERAPAEYGTMSMYMSNQFHSAYVNTDPNHLRWSYAIMSHQKPE